MLDVVSYMKISGTRFRTGLNSTWYIYDDSGCYNKSGFYTSSRRTNNSLPIATHQELEIERRNRNKYSQKRVVKVEDSIPKLKVEWTHFSKEEQDLIIRIREIRQQNEGENDEN